MSLLAIREKRGVPQVLGTDRHYTEGAVELEGVSWKLAIYVPEGYAWDEKGIDYYHDYPNFSANSSKKNVLQARLDFNETERVKWVFKFT